MKAQIFRNVGNYSHTSPRSDVFLLALLDREDEGTDLSKRRELLAQRHSVTSQNMSVQQKPLSEPQTPLLFKSLLPWANHRVKGASLML
jgi:hypothetical protein